MFQHKIVLKLLRIRSQAGLSGQATPHQALKERKMPPIALKIQKVDNAFVNAVKAQNNDLVSFEYTSDRLKKTASQPVIIIWW